jgi:chromosome segregation ATPase
MTFEEAKKILEKEGFYLIKFGGPSDIIKNPFSEYESPEIFEAGKVVNSAGYGVGMHSEVSNIRLYRLKKEYETSTKAPGPGEEQPKEGNPALAESASQFNDALLDEQAKEIERLKKENAELLGIVERMKQDVKEVDYNFNAVCKENERLNEKIRELINEKTNLEDQITVLNACKKHNDKIDRKQIKCLGKEIAKLNGIIHDKNAILSDVAEELRLTKIREKNLTEVIQKYMNENEEFKKELADKVVDKIDAQALKSAESALAYKERVIAEKNEVIADLTHELKAKHKKYVWYKGAYDAAQQILNTIADYAAKHPDKKISDPMVEENHPTIDNPEEIEIEKAVKLVRKAMKEGHTVTIDYKD